MAEEHRYPHLFKPLCIGSVVAKNRINFEPTAISCSNADGSISELDIAVYSEIAKGGYSKDDVRRFLFEHARVPAWQFDDRLNRSISGLTLEQSVREGRLADIFVESDSPDRMVPVVHRPEEFFIVVAGSPIRNRNFIAGQIGEQGLTVSKKIRD